MKKILIMVVCAALAGCCKLSCEKKVTKKDLEGEVKEAILLVAFGTSEKSAQVSFTNIARLAAKRFKGAEIQWAYTSHIIRKKLAKQGQIILSPVEAIDKLIAEGYNKLTIQSLHTIPGAEFDDLCKVAESYKDRVIISIGQPLVANYANLDRVVDLMLEQAPKERKADEAIIFMGHGTHHYANLIDVAFQALLNDKDKNSFIGTVEGNPTLDDIIKKCKANNIKKAYLIPFMSVAGDHAKNDMASDEDDSWKSILKKNGITAIPILKGTAENDKIVDVWLDNCAEALKGKSNH